MDTALNWTMRNGSAALSLLLGFIVIGLMLAASGHQADAAPAQKGGQKNIVFIAGYRSHGYGMHEHYAGCCLLAKLLGESLPDVKTVVHRDGWPKAPKALENADAVVIYCDGGGGHVAIPHLDELERLMKKGVGLACIHYAVTVPKGKPGDLMLDWMGGYYETFWSINPTWVAEVKEFPDHPIARGVKPFAIKDEWYYHMRFRKGMKGVTPILTAVPPDGTRKGKDGAHSGNPHVRARMGKPEHLAWAVERPDGGRGFGFCGGHWHWNWAHDDFRMIAINAIAWVARIEVPPEGVRTRTPTLEELEANQDFPQPKNWKRESVQKMIDGFNRRPAREK